MGNRKSWWGLSMRPAIDPVPRSCIRSRRRATRVSGFCSNDSQFSILDSRP
ncbi:hypothetical protein [Lysobacter gummosus]|uniref:hypothetical protein n=1 Tax=Lysobacter gummosus TaxID=262324 RepID=UPI00363B0855